MTETLDYATPTRRPPSRALAVFAHITAAYPLYLHASLYGQWLLSWWVLGHRPVPSIDDPKYIAGANWMHPMTYVMLLGVLPTGMMAVILNVLYVMTHRVSDFPLAVRIVLVGALWTTTYFLLRWDPGRVLYWWMD